METPIAKLAHRWAHRGQRPDNRNTCDYCGVDVPRDGGRWEAGWSELLCGTEACDDAARASHSW